MRYAHPVSSSLDVYKKLKRRLFCSVVWCGAVRSSSRCAVIQCEKMKKKKKIKKTMTISTLCCLSSATKIRMMLDGGAGVKGNPFHGQFDAVAEYA